MIDVKEVGIWAVAAGVIVGVVVAKPFKAYSGDVEVPETVTETHLYESDVTEKVTEIETEAETETAAETRADIEYYLERWSFAERVEETETETEMHLEAGCFAENLSIIVSDEMSMDLSEADITALQKIAIAEASVDGVEGEALVMRVVLNRVYSSEFPDSVTEVISQYNQFATYANGSYETAVPDETSAEAWSMVENGWDESQGAMWFERTSEGDTWHSTSLTYLFTYGGHSFYTN